MKNKEELILFKDVLKMLTSINEQLKNLQIVIINNRDKYRN